MSTIIDTSDWPSIAELRQRNKNGETQCQIARSLGVSRAKLTDYLAGKVVIDPQSPEAITASDQGFIARMQAAIRSGSEKATFGIVTTAEPSRAKRIGTPTTGSGCGSPAAMCAI